LWLERKASALISWSVEREVSLYVQQSDFHLINAFCAVITKNVLSLAWWFSRILYCTDTFVTHDQTYAPMRSLLFTQQD